MVLYEGTWYDIVDFCCLVVKLSGMESVKRAKRSTIGVSGVR